MSSYLRSVVTWDERQTHRECVRRVSNSSRTYISIYMANIWWPWRRLSGGKVEGLGALRGTQCRRSTNALKRICWNLQFAMGLVCPRRRRSRSK